MPVHCTEHQDWGVDGAGSGHRARFFSWPSRCGGEEIRLIVRDKELFVNREQVRASFCKTDEVWLYALDLDPTAIGERWQAQHHHQLRTSLIHRILKMQE